MPLKDLKRRINQTVDEILVSGSDGIDRKIYIAVLIDEIEELIDRKITERVKQQSLL